MFSFKIGVAEAGGSGWLEGRRWRHMAATSGGLDF